jgi:hypothetical protein
MYVQQTRSGYKWIWSPCINLVAEKEKPGFYLYIRIGVFSDNWGGQVVGVIMDFYAVE